METKICSYCKIEKSIEEFHKNKNGKDGLNYYCKKCVREISEKYRETHKEELKAKHKQYCETHKEELKAKAIAKKVMVWGKISNNEFICNKCGCDDLRLLEINHIKGGGRKEQKMYGGGEGIYNKIIQGERPTDDLELLCRICNAHHYLELKYGKLPFGIIYNKGDN